MTASTTADLAPAAGPQATELSPVFAVLMDRRTTVACSMSAISVSGRRIDAKQASTGETPSDVKGDDG